MTSTTKALFLLSLLSVEGKVYAAGSAKAMADQSIVHRSRVKKQRAPTVLGSQSARKPMQPKPP
jgi:hypothetical protein